MATIKYSDIKATTATSVDATSRLAESIGLTAVYPEDDEIFIDWDKHEDWDLAKAEMILSERDAYVISCSRVKSKSGNQHIVLALDKIIDKADKIILSMFLGSDPERCAISLWKLIVFGCPEALFETPEAFDSFQKWRVQKRESARHTFP